jgi:hypothetical protein
MGFELKKVVQESFDDVVLRRKKLVEKYRSTIDYLNAVFEEEGKPALTDLDEMNVAVCCENACWDVAARSKQNSILGTINETTYQDNISFLGVQLPVIAALVPTLVLNKIGIVQALDRRSGAVFYMNIKYGQTKGQLAINSQLIGAKTGHATGTAARRYASQYLYGEGLQDVFSITKTISSRQLVYSPVIAGTAVVTCAYTGGVETFTDDGANNLVSDLSAGGSGTINYTTGVVSLTAKNNFSAIPTIDYKYNYEKATNGVPETNFEIVAENITAEDFPIRSKYTVGTAIDAMKAHGISLEDEVVKILGGEIRFTMDHFGIDMIYNAAIGANAATTSGNFDATVSTGQEWVWRKHQILRNIAKGSNNIFRKTLRARANFILCGDDPMAIISELGSDHFKPSADFGRVVPSGPYEAGTLDGKIVIHDPFLPTDRYVLGYKGESFLQAGFVFAPYIPLFATPTITTSDMQVQKGFMSSGGFKMINEGMYCYGSVTNYN